MTTFDCRLVSDAGWSRRFDAGGLVLGRRADCDVVLSGSAISRRHAVLRATADGAELHPLGTRPPTLNGRPVEAPTPLANGDRLELEAHAFTVVLEAMPEATLPWLVEPQTGALHAVLRSPFVVGGAPADDLVVDGWPPGALHLHLADGRLLVELEAEGRVDEEEVEVGELIAVADGSQVEIAGRSLRVRNAGRSGDRTTVAREVGGASRVHLEFLQRGGRVEVDFGGKRTSLVLSDRPFDLLAALLQPVDGAPGDYVSDELVFTRVWGAADPSRERDRINLLVHRARKALLAAGMDGKALLQRAPGGRATKFALLPGAEVEVH